MPVTQYIRELLGKGLPLEQALIAAEVYEATPPTVSKSVGAIRQERYRRNKASRVTVGDVCDAGDGVSPDKEKSPTPPKEIKPLPASLPNGSSAPRALDDLQNRLVEAAGISGFRDERHPKLLNLRPIIDLIEAGYSLEADVLPVIRDKCRGGFVPKTWGYFSEAIIEGASRRAAIPQKPAAQAEDWPKRIHVFRMDGTWAAGWGPKPGESGCRCPPGLVEEKAA